jgi:hypothetical protein
MPMIQKQIQSADKIYNKIIKKMISLDTLIDKFNAKTGDSVPASMQKNLENYGAKINALMGDFDEYVSNIYGKFNVKASRVVEALEDIDVKNLGDANKIYLKLVQNKADIDDLMGDFEAAMSKALPDDMMQKLLLHSVQFDDTTEQYLGLVETLYPREATAMKRKATHLEVYMPDGTKYEINGFPDASEMMRVHKDLKKNVEGAVAVQGSGNPKVFHGEDWVDITTFEPEALRNMGVSKTILDKYMKKSAAITQEEPTDEKAREKQLDEIETLITEQVQKLKSKKYDAIYEVQQLTDQISDLNRVLQKFWHSGMNRSDWDTVKKYIDIPEWVWKHSLKHLPPKGKSILDKPEYTQSKESGYHKNFKDWDISEDMYKKLKSYMFGEAKSMMGKDGEVNATELAENAAHDALDKDHDEWLDDETNPIWDIALEVSESFNK